MKRNILLIVSALLLLPVLSLSVVQAMNITQEFVTDEDLAIGTIISVVDQQRTIKKTSAQNVQQMYGVVAKTGDISLSQGGAESAVSVANTGIISAIVSTVAGDISSGDPITVRSLEGVGEKASQSGRIIGIAQADFNSQSPGAETITVTQNNTPKQAAVGLLDIRVNASDYTPATTPIDQTDAENRNLIERIADNVAGKTVRTFGLIVASILLLAGIFISTFLITSSSYASMISIGRNPLAEKKVIKSLLGLILLSVAIFCTSLLLAYGALRILG